MHWERHLVSERLHSANKQKIFKWECKSGLHYTVIEIDNTLVWDYTFLHAGLLICWHCSVKRDHLCWPFDMLTFFCQKRSSVLAFWYADIVLSKEIICAGLLIGRSRKSLQSLNSLNQWDINIVALYMIMYKEKKIIFTLIEMYISVSCICTL